MIGRSDEVVEHVGQPAQDVRGEEGVLEELDDVGVVEADAVGVRVLAVVDVLEVVVVDEVEDAVRGDVPAARDADVAEHVLVLGRAGHDLRGEVEAGRLAPEAPVAAGRVDDALAELVEVRDREVLLGDVHELELVGQEAPHERRAQAHLGGGREVRLLDPAVAEALERVRQLRERRVHALERVLEERGLVLLDPALDAVEDLVLPQVQPGDPEGGVRRLRVGRPGGPRLRPVVVDALLAAGRARRDGRAQEAFRLLDAVPAQVVDHLAAQAREQRPVGLPQEVEHHPPLRGGRARPAVDRQHALQAAARHEVAEPLRDRVEELALLGEEGPLGRAGHRLRVVDLDLPGDLALRLEQRRQLERRGREARRLVDPVAEDDPRDAHVRELPARGNGADHLAEDVVEGRLLAAEKLVDAVEAVELLGPLLQVVEDPVDRLVGRRVHSLSGPLGDTRGASARPRAGRGAPACGRAGRARCGPRPPARRASPSLPPVRCRRAP